MADKQIVIPEPVSDPQAGQFLLHLTMIISRDTDGPKLTLVYEPPGVKPFHKTYRVADLPAQARQDGSAFLQAVVDLAKSETDWGFSP